MRQVLGEIEERLLRRATALVLGALLLGGFTRAEGIEKASETVRIVGRGPSASATHNTM